MTSKTAAPAMSEAAITRAVILHWRTRGIEGTLVASIPNAMSHGQAGLTKGLPDLLVLSKHLPGGTGFLELKTVKGKLSEHQEIFKLAAIRVGASIAVAYGLDQALEVLETWHVIKPEARG